MLTPTIGGGGGLAAVGAERGWRGTDVVEGWGGQGAHGGIYDPT